MGKRELLLIGAFIFLGAVLYQVTAPARPEGGGFSLRTVIDSMRREMGPRHEYLGDEREETIPIGPEIAEVHVARVRRLEVRGTDARQVRLHLKVYSTGLNENEARGFARRVALRRQRSGDILSFDFDYPREARQRAELVLELPSRLRMRLTRVAGGIDARNLAGLELDETAGEAMLSGIAGGVRGSHAGGAIVIENTGAIDLAVRRCEVTMSEIAGNVRLDASSGGSLTARGVRGTMDVEGNRLAVELERVDGAIRADLTQGHFEASAVSSDIRVDARGTEIRIELAKPVPTTAYTTDETVDVRLPAEGGFTLDAGVEDGDVRLPPGAPEVATLDDARRARGPLRGGGPPLELRTTHADIVIR